MTGFDVCVTPDVPPLHPESVLVMLTRMEGKLDRFGDRIVDLRGQVDAHGADLSLLKSKTQALEQDALASKDVALVAAQEEVKRAAQGWSPVTKLFAVAFGVMAFINIYQELISL